MKLLVPFLLLLSGCLTEERVRGIVYDVLATRDKDAIFEAQLERDFERRLLKNRLLALEQAVVGSVPEGCKLVVECETNDLGATTSCRHFFNCRTHTKTEAKPTCTSSCGEIKILPHAGAMPTLE